MTEAGRLLLVTAIIAGYSLGSIPTGILLCQYKNIDIRKYGSGNIGAANVGRALGKKYMYLTMFLDAFKAFLPVFIVMQIGFSAREISIVATAVLAGNLMPIFADFKGGKGASHALGIIIAIDYRIAIISFVTRKIILYVTKISSVGTLAGVLLTPLLVWGFGHPTIYIILTVGICALVLYAHRKNIHKLLRGKENKLTV